ncbi:MAG: SdiA-regulated domain-containing protein [Ignavibacteria bacterium]|nr:SdiA-regulated domain-containing protein [Ignavibacteria bacterium]
MKIYLTLLFTVVTLFLFSSCSKDQTVKDGKNKKEGKEKATDDIANSELSKYDLSSENPQIINLPKELKEISGITMTPDGRLFGQQDESGIIYQIDFTTGAIIKKFAVGKPALKKDFEDLVYANNKFYLLHSNGEIFEFPEGNDRESVEYNVYKTELTAANDVEGLCYDSETNSLLLACKGNSGVDGSGDKAIYSFSLESMKLNPQPRFILKKSDVVNSFNPSGIQRNPLTGTFFLIAANGSMIVEISKEGNYIGKASLPKRIHFQPEGITFSSDGTLFISNEGNSGGGSIMIYPLIKN